MLDTSWQGKRDVDPESVLHGKSNQYRIHSFFKETERSMLYKGSLNGKEVMVKILKPNRRKDSKLTKQFQQGGEMLERFGGQRRIVPLYEYVRDCGNGDAIVTEYAPYGTAAIRRDGSHLTKKEVVQVTKEAAEALDHINNQGIVHQDVTPGNLLLPQPADIWLSDFDLAHSIDTPQDPKFIFGTPAHWAPELLKDKAIPASDKYGLAVSVYFLLTGKYPITEKLPTEIYKMIQEEEKENPQVRIAFAHLFVKPSAPSGGDRIIHTIWEEALQRALAKDPEKRFATNTHFAQAVHQGYIRGLEEERKAKRYSLYHYNFRS